MITAYAISGSLNHWLLGQGMFPKRHISNKEVHALARRLIDIELVVPSIGTVDHSMQTNTQIPAMMMFALAGGFQLRPPLCMGVGVSFHCCVENTWYDVSYRTYVYFMVNVSNHRLVGRLQQSHRLADRVKEMPPPLSAAFSAQQQCGTLNSVDISPHATTAKKNPR